MLVFVAIMLGLHRATRFHPAHDAKYRLWLKTSPWTAGVDLPLGPITLVWQDVLCLLLLTGITTLHDHLHPALVLLAFGAAYTVSVLPTLMNSDQHAAAMAIAIALAGVVRFADDKRIMVLILLGIYPLIHVALRRSLKSFPWEPKDQPATATGLGWTFERLGPHLPPSGITDAWSVSTAALFGAWAYAVLWHEAVETEPRGPLLCLAIGGFAMAFFRFACYALNNQPPLSLLGRLNTRRFLIPRYDVIYVIPILTCVYATVLPALMACHAIALSMPVFGGLYSAGLMLLVLLPGPTFRDWTLTGTYTMVGQARHAAGMQK